MSPDDNSEALSSPVGGREFFVSGQELWQWRQSARAAAIAASVPPAELDWLLQTLGDVDRLALRLDSFQARSQIRFQLPFPELQNRWQQRLQERVPVQYLAGVAPWREFWLTVSPAVLIPRPETETLIDLAQAAAQGTALATGHWGDLGTGSGAIALGLATSFPAATIHAIDTSAEALRIARLNAQRYQVSDRIHFAQGSWFAPLAHLRNPLSGMVSNPPYIPHSFLADLQPEVIQHEPQLALDGGEDGLDCVRQLVEMAPAYLHSGAVWLVELMAGQAIAVADLLESHGRYEAIEIHPDLAGIDRFVLARLQPDSR